MWAAMTGDLIGSRQGTLTEIEEAKKSLLYRHLAWMNMLRLQLRRNPVFREKEYTTSAQLKIIRKTRGEHNYEQHAEEIFQKFLSADERKSAARKTNLASWLLQQQNAALIQCKNNNWLDEYEHSDMSKIILELYNQQGASERIKSFPFPRQYANFSLVFVYIIIALLPFAIINDLDKLGNNTAWLVIPLTILIAWVFNVMEQVGDASENPFDNGINDIPMTAICRNIENEFKELLNEKDLPPQLKPVNGILM